MISTKTEIYFNACFGKG